MNKHLLLFAAALLSASLSSAQKNLSGTWQGALSLAGTSLDVSFHFTQSGPTYTAKMDVPEQAAKGISLSKVTVSGDSLFMEVASIGGAAAGRLTSDSLFRGVWTQGKAVVPMELRRLSSAEKTAGPARPQTPKPPFPYESRDVVFHSPDSSTVFGATLTYPRARGPFPAVLLLTGSGQQNRDEEIFDHKPFAVLADYLTRRGYLVMRVDDRGIGQSTGKFSGATTLDFAQDATTAFEYLKRHPLADTTRLGLLGHSEGGMIAQILAARRTDVHFVLLLGAPGQPVIDLMAEQSRMVLTSSGIDKDAAASYEILYKKLAVAATANGSDSKAQKAVFKALNDWIDSTPRAHVVATTGIYNDETKAAFAAQMMQGLRSPWFRYFLSYNPDENVRAIRAKVLAINGSKDIQVASGPNLAALKTSLEKSGAPTFKTVELKGLNHLFQTCAKCTVAEYGELEETFSPDALETIGEWLKKNVL